MSMTKEEAITYLQEKYDYCKSFYDLAAHPEEDYPEMTKYLQALQIALSSLRPITRERVEKIRGEWIDIDGETVPVDKYGQTLGWAECSACGQYLTASDEYPCTGHFCPNCGAPMTDEAVDMVMERLEALYGQENT